MSGNYVQGAGGALEAEIGGTIVGTGYDRLLVGGSATLDGTLALITLGGFDPQVSDSFDLLSAGALTGTFATITGQAVGNGSSYDVQYGTTGVTATVQT